jgi:hypothetical protein
LKMVLQRTKAKLVMEAIWFFFSVWFHIWWNYILCLWEA